MKSLRQRDVVKKLSFAGCKSLPAWVQLERKVKMLMKLYYRELRAVRITRKNYPALKELDVGDGVLSEGVCTFEEVEGDWFVETEVGYEVMAGNVILIPVKKLKTNPRRTGGGTVHGSTPDMTQVRLVVSAAVLF